MEENNKEQKIAEIEGLVLEAKKGDMDAEAILMEKFKPFIVSRAMKVKIKNYDLEDLIQIGNISIMYAISKYKPEPNKHRFVSYVTRTISNRFYELIRKKSACNIEVTIEQEDRLGISIGDRLLDGFSVEDNYIMEEQIFELREAIKEMPKLYRESIEETFLKETTVKEYSNRIGVPYRTIIKRRRRAIIKLRNMLS